MKEIQNIILDLGNVLLDLDFDQMNTSFRTLLGMDFYDLTTSEGTKEVFLQFETGRYSEESFINALQRLAVKVPDGREMINAWNALLVGIPGQRLEMLTNLKNKGYQLYLLSNTNSLHVHWLNKYLRNTYGITNFDERFFIKSYYSHLVQMRKPDLEMYRYVLTDAFISAEETLFIDSNRDNVLAAQQVGMTVLHHNSKKDISEVLKGVL